MKRKHDTDIAIGAIISVIIGLAGIVFIAFRVAYFALETFMEDYRATDDH